MTQCDDCGAAIPDGETCRSLFERLLAYEYSFPEAFGAVHHLTVATYSLQHPRGFSRDAIRMWRIIIGESLAGLSTPQNFLERVQAHFTGGLRVRQPGAEPPDGWPHVWPMTVADVVAPPDEEPSAGAHIERVRRWAGVTNEAVASI